MRTYIRHPTNIPIDIQENGAEANAHQRLQNISYGGLAFSSQHAYVAGSEIVIRINSVKPVFEAHARVTYCKPENSSYVIGLEFVNKDDVFRARMVEQVCHIQHYRDEVLKDEGRKLADDEAAREWVARYAAKFPNPVDE